MATWDLPAGEYEYKAALNGAWDENYGLNAARDGANIPLVLEEDTSVTFFYSHNSHWVTDNVTSVIASVPGDYQDEIGCPSDWAPDCLRSWMQDPTGDGLYAYSTFLIPPGDYEAKVALNQSWEPENYGLDGEPFGPNIPFSVPAVGHAVTFTYDAETNDIEILISEEPVATPDQIADASGPAVAGDLGLARAYWVTADTIAWAPDYAEGDTAALHVSPDASLSIEEEGVTGGESIPLTVNEEGLPEEVVDKFPHLAGLTAFTLPAEAIDRVPDLLRGQTAVALTDSEGTLKNATSLQIPGVLDDLFTYDGELGVSYQADRPTLRVWAPTAQNVSLLLAETPDAEPTPLEMERDPENGTWSIEGEGDWTYQYYQYAVTVYVPSTQTIETNIVTDPYSASLSANSTHSQIVDLANDASLRPEGWADLTKPELDAFEDIILYELHIRDFSVSDETVPEDLRGTFMAFTEQSSNGMQHLQALATSGLTHIHLLPAFDIATINEIEAERREPDLDELAFFGPASEAQQNLIDSVRDRDAFNWGYDPYHYTVPEGSYATDPMGTARILEYRQMVQALNEADLRVVMDVVYNHTNASGQSEKSVLDKVVPGYYHRLNATGGVETSTCCQNTATEHTMMRKLMVDSTVTWATAYKVDGFRFDLMGHHMVEDMLAVRAALDELTLADDGVDGEAIYIYGEGWNFGEVADGARGTNATQLNMAGTGIGTFNDRLRDAARGGSPFGGQQEQGFINGLYTYPNEATPGEPEQQLERLLLFADQIRVGLAGNLAAYTFTNAAGETVTGSDIDYNGSPAGYNQDPQEHIIYVSAHDNETLWDKVQYTAPAEADIDQRVRMHNMGISLTGLAQGVPFYHAGVDMLRSKSLDRNSYNSGDWFNRLDFTYETNNWGVGVPPAADNASQYEVMKPLLENPDLAVTQEDILRAVNHTREIIELRKSSPLFRLQTADEIQNRVVFHNTGPDQIPGVIVMSISDLEGADLDPTHDFIVVVFNASDAEITFSADALDGLALSLHPVQVTSIDPVVQAATASDGSVTVPALTTAVFVVEQ